MQKLNSNKKIIFSEEYASYQAVAINTCNVSPFKLALNMPAKNLLRVADKGTYSHIYNRGVENRLIFNDAQDYEVFLGYIREYLSAPADQTTTKRDFTVNGRTYKGSPHLPKNYYNKVELLAYSLLPNHFHLVLHQAHQGSIESFLRSLSTRYSMYFNKKSQRHGSLFEGPYKSAQILESATLVNFVAYLDQKHKGNIYSSHADYIGSTAGSMVRTDVVNNLLSSAEDMDSQGHNSFAQFAENHKFTTETVSEMERLLLESKTESLERRNLETLLPQPEKTPLKQSNLKPAESKTRIPEYITLTAGFIVLLTLGIWNVNISSIQAMTSTTGTTPVETTNTAEVPPTIIDGLPEPQVETTVLAATESATEAMIESTEPTDLLFTPIQILEGANIVNIYNTTSIRAEIHRTAKEGEFFDGAPVDLDWYEVRLDEQTTGFIQSEYVKLRQTTNQ